MKCLKRLAGLDLQPCEGQLVVLGCEVLVEIRILEELLDVLAQDRIVSTESE